MGAHTTNTTLATTTPLFQIPIKIIDGLTGEALIAVSVFTDDHTFVAFTDENGQCEIADLGHRDMVNFSYVGYAPLQIPYFELRKMGGIIKMFPSTTLDSIVIVGRRDDPVEEIPFVVDRISKEEIAFKNSQTTADALGANADVFIQKSQMGGGSPIIRGFEANKVLLVVDGVRMNNAIYRSGHLQNSITIDNSILEQVEVIYGPGSLMYGSDALGGVVHFRTKDPKVLFAKNGVDHSMATNVYTRASSANNEKTFHLDLDYRSRRWGTFTSITYADYGNLRAGSKRPAAYPDLGKRLYYVVREEQDMTFGPDPDPNILRNTAYNQIDLLQKVKYQPSDSLYFIFNVQFSTSSIIPRYDNLIDTVQSAIDLKFAEWYYGPQKRLFSSLKMRNLKPNFLHDKSTFIASAQRIDEDRLQRKNEDTRRTYNLEDVYVFSLTGDFDKKFGKKKRSLLSYGFEGNHNMVFSDAGKITMTTGAVSRGGVFTRYPSKKSAMTSMAGYLNYRWKTNDSVFSFNGGLRYSNVRLHALYDEADLDLIQWPDSYTNGGIGTNNSDLTWGAGITINTKDKWQLRVLGSTAFRSPNIDDFAKIRVKGQFAVLPNTDLAPESSINGEVTLAKEIGRMNGDRGTTLKLSSTGFYTHITDAIIRKLGQTPSGDSCIMVDGSCYTVQQNFNESTAFIYGVSGNLQLKVNKNWTFKSGINFTRGRTEFTYEPGEDKPFPAVDTIVPLSHIPPIYGQSSFGYQNDRFRIEGVLRYTARKSIEEYAITGAEYDDLGNLTFDRGGSSDNLEFTPFDLGENGEINYVGSLAWTTLNIYSSFKFNDRFSIDVALENITDIHYIPFSSGLSAAGRNYIVTLRGTF